MPTHNKTSKTEQLSAIRRMRKGIDKHFNGQTLILDGKKPTAADLVARLTEFEAMVSATANALSNWQDRVRLEQNARTTFVVPTMKALRVYVRSMLGGLNPNLVDFGLKLTRPVRKSPKAKVAAAEKAKATRQARHTMGRRQKQKIKGGG